MSDLTINVNLTGYNKSTKSFSVDGSDLWAAGHDFGPGHNITLASSKTGNNVTFKPVKTIYDHSGEDVMGWEYSPVTKNAPVSKLTVWND